MAPESSTVADAATPRHRLPPGITFASFQALGMGAGLEMARLAADLGFASFWTAETTGPEAFATLAAAGAAAPALNLGTGVLALQLRTPLLAVQGAATLQALSPEREINLGVGISSPVVVGRWHGARYGDRPLSQTREWLEVARPLIDGDKVRHDGDHYRVGSTRLGVRLGERRPRLVLGALNRRMLTLAGEQADGVLLNYLPASAVPWCVEQVRAGEAVAGRAPGSVRISAYVHIGLCDAGAARPKARRDLFSYAVVPAYAKAFARAGFGDEVEALNAALAADDREGAVAAMSDAMVDAINICGDAATLADAVDAYVEAGVDEPVIMPLPWGEDRLGTIAATMEAVAEGHRHRAAAVPSGPVAATPIINTNSARRDTGTDADALEATVETLARLDAAEEAFRAHGHALIDWVADYWGRTDTLDVGPSVTPGWVRDQLDAHPPEHGGDLAGAIADLDRVIVPALTHWQAPGFFGYFPANSSPPAVLAELVSAGLGVQGMLWATSPAVTELEEHMLDWLVEACGLPERFRHRRSDGTRGTGGGVLQDSASSGTLCAILAARHRRGVGTTDGPSIDRCVVYGTGETHSSLEKDARVAGIPAERVRAVATNERLGMDPSALAEAITADQAAGLLPLLVCATAGTTSTGAFDPVPAIAAVTEPVGVWLHLDAAWAGSATVDPEFRWVIDGVDRVDSYVFNPHKWLLTNFDCSALWVADRTPLVEALSILPEYLRTAQGETGEVNDLRDWQVPLGRRFRSLKLFFVLRHYGLEGLRAHIRSGVDDARWLEERVQAHPTLELVMPRSLALVTLAHVDGDQATQRLLDAIAAERRWLCTRTVADGRLAVRVAIGSPRSTRATMVAFWDFLCEAAR
ncbi:MAG: LLM class flavin-dependent oxidoreductase [Microthrixaceae bacterium]